MGRIEPISQAPNASPTKPSSPIAAGASQDEVIAAYAHEIERLKRERGYITVDVVSLNSDHPQKAELRAKFLDEHRHAEDEVRFFVEGAAHGGGIEIADEAALNRFGLGIAEKVDHLVHQPELDEDMRDPVE